MYIRIQYSNQMCFNQDGSSTSLNHHFHGYPWWFWKFVAAHWLPPFGMGKYKRKAPSKTRMCEEAGCQKETHLATPAQSFVFRSLFKAIWQVNNGHFNEQCPVLCGLIQRWCFRNPANQLVSSLSQYLRRVLYIVQVVTGSLDFSAPATGAPRSRSQRV